MSSCYGFGRSSSSTVRCAYVNPLDKKRPQVEIKQLRITITVADSGRRGVSLVLAVVTERPVSPVVSEQTTRLGGADK